MSSQTDPAFEPECVNSLEDAASWLDEYGDALYRHARSRVGRRELAEDLVQETLLAALAAREDFRGLSAVRTWLLAILRRKIADYYRRKELPVEPDADGTDFTSRRSAIEGHVFRDDGSFRQTPARWKSPPESLEEGELREVLDRCMARLPAGFAVAFTLRELDQVPADEIRRRLGLSAGNLRVRLYRARMMLRECLEKNWFAPRPANSPTRP
jgi:RNA polymerase sigma-70 factor (TIGR02943 family)